MKCLFVKVGIIASSLLCSHIVYGKTIDFSDCQPFLHNPHSPYYLDSKGELIKNEMAMVEGLEVNLKPKDKKTFQFKTDQFVFIPGVGQSMVPVKSENEVLFKKGAPISIENKQTIMRDGKEDNLPVNFSSFRFSYNKEGNCQIEEINRQDMSQFSQFKASLNLYRRETCKKLRRQYTKSKLSDKQKTQCMEERNRFMQAFSNEIQRLRKKGVNVALPFKFPGLMPITIGPNSNYTIAEMYVSLCGAIMDGKGYGLDGTALSPLPKNRNKKSGKQ